MSARSEYLNFELADGGRVDDRGDLVRLHWFEPSRKGGEYSKRKEAAFEIASSEYAVLQFIHTARVHGDRASWTNAAVGVEEIPEDYLEVLRQHGFEPVDELYGEVSA
jgi:hypothetical protein